MARSTFKVLFYVNGSKEKDGIVPIMGRVTINGTVVFFGKIIMKQNCLCKLLLYFHTWVQRVHRLLEDHCNFSMYPFSSKI